MQVGTNGPCSPEVPRRHTHTPGTWPKALPRGERVAWSGLSQPQEGRGRRRVRPPTGAPPPTRPPPPGHSFTLIEQGPQLLGPSPLTKRLVSHTHTVCLTTALGELRGEKGVRMKIPLIHRHTREMEWEGLECPGPQMPPLRPGARLRTRHIPDPQPRIPTTHPRAHPLNTPAFSFRKWLLSLRQHLLVQPTTVAQGKWKF